MVEFRTPDSLKDHEKKMICYVLLSVAIIVFILPATLVMILSDILL